MQLSNIEQDFIMTMGNLSKAIDSPTRKSGRFSAYTNEEKRNIASLFILKSDFSYNSHHQVWQYFLVIYVSKS